jgi:hypothetical protein
MSINWTASISATDLRVSEITQGPHEDTCGPFLFAILPLHSHKKQKTALLRGFCGTCLAADILSRPVNFVIVVY